MAVSVKKLDSRAVYEVSYDKSAVNGSEITAKFENPGNGDVSVYAGKNDGKFIVTADASYNGTDSVSIKGSDGGEETGEVSFG